jgi:membrane glycosyltransferase
VATEPVRELRASASGAGASGAAAHDASTLDRSASDSPSSEASHVRARGVDLPSRATRRVAEYLWTLGLADGARVLALAEAIALEAYVEDAEEHASASVRLAQGRFASWRTAVFSGFGREPDPLWLRAFLAATPAVFLEDPALGRAAAQKFGDLETGRSPVHAQFAAQGLEPARIPAWLRGLLPPVFVTTGAALALLVALGGAGIGALELAWVGLFAFLFGLSAIGCCTAMLGLGRQRGERPSVEPVLPAPAAPLPRSAVVMPVYHESAEEVFAALAAMRDSLLACPGAEAFEIFVLSDSRDPLLAAEEERAFRRVTARSGDAIPMYYRRRAQNYRQKAGNLSEFFERWGHRYEYVVVLDADSLMTGASMVELVRRMHASPRLALLQAPIALAGGETPFARMLQFASSLCGPLFTRGLARWSGPHGNYYGHNAAIRVRAFLECCALPRLAGKPPFGGEILSHDFVEAALLCREGWEVRMAHDLGGSFEGLPPTLVEYVARDRRWCQGNLQHLRVLGATGLRPMSRLHLMLGVAAYLAGPAWLLFLICGIALSQTRSAVDVQLGVWVTACTAALLLVPRLLGLLVTAARAEARRAHGGILGLGFGLLFELVLAAALAPLLMLHHTRIVLSILFGNAVGWGVQRRRATGGFGAILRSEGSTTLLGLALLGGIWQWAPELLGWLAPIWAPWSLAIPLAAFASSKRIGALTRRLGLLLVPSETEPHELVTLAEELCAFTASDQAARFRDLVLDPVLVSAHVARLSTAKDSRATASAGAELRQRALRVGPAGLSEAERQMLTQDAESMHWLHREAWCHWPVEAWKLSHERPQLPEL